MTDGEYRKENEGKAAGPGWWGAGAAAGRHVGMVAVSPPGGEGGKGPPAASLHQGGCEMGRCATGRRATRSCEMGRELCHGELCNVGLCNGELCDAELRTMEPCNGETCTGEPCNGEQCTGEGDLQWGAVQ